MSKLSIGGAVATCLFCAACAHDPAEKALTAADLAGKWEIVAAQRDSTDSDMLKGHSFTFTGDRVATTLPLTQDSIVQSAFTLKGDSIVLTDLHTSFQIGTHSPDTMNLQTKMQGFRFSMCVVKQH